MTHHLRHAARFALGVILVLLGIAGLLLPIVPGWAFLIPGLVLLADYLPPVRRLLDWARAKAEPHLRKYRKSPDESGEQS